jgi:hypothetical protein
MPMHLCTDGLRRRDARPLPSSAGCQGRMISRRIAVVAARYEARLPIKQTHCGVIDHSPIMFTAEVDSTHA